MITFSVRCKAYGKDMTLENKMDQKYFLQIC